MSRNAPIAKKRAKVKRSDIPRESIKRLIKKGAGMSVARTASQQVRVARGTPVAVQRVAVSLVEQLSSECQRYLRGHKTKTTTDKTLAYVIDTIKRRGLDIEAIHAASFSEKHPTLSKAGIVRIFKKHAGGSDIRVSEKAKTMLVVTVEAYIVYLGKVAGRYATAGTRTTIKPADITSALSDA